MPTEWWFPDHRAEGTSQQIAAVEVCQACPVYPECLAYAQTMSRRKSYDAGIWAGRVFRRHSGWVP